MKPHLNVDEQCLRPFAGLPSNLSYALRLTHPSLGGSRTQLIPPAVLSSSLLAGALNSASRCDKQGGQLLGPGRYAMPIRRALGLLFLIGAVTTVVGPQGAAASRAPCGMWQGCSAPRASVSCGAASGCGNPVTDNDPSLVDDGKHAHDPWWLWTTWIIVAGAFTMWGFRKPLARVLQSSERHRDPVLLSPPARPESKLSVGTRSSAAGRGIEPPPPS